MNSPSHSAQRIVIVGGGFAGLSIAVRLSQAGLPVTLFEASQLGFAASTRNQGWLHSGAWFAPEHTELARMCHGSLQQTMQFCPDCFEPQHRGMAYLISKPDTRPAGWTAAWERAEIPYEELSRSELFAALPGLAPSEVQHAFLLPDRAFRPDVLLAHLAATAKNAGVEIRTETPIVDINQANDRAEGVVTGGGENVSARLIVLAGGAPGIALRSLIAHEEAGRQPECTPVPLKTHLVAVKPDIGRLPFCVVDADGFNHVPHAPTSVFGLNRWLPVSNVDDQQVAAAEIGRLWDCIGRFLPQLHREDHEVLEWAGTTIQAMHADQIEPGQAPLPTVIDHRCECTYLENLISVFPGRATLWPQLAEQTRKLVLEKLEHTPTSTTVPPWAQPG